MIFSFLRGRVWAGTYASSCPPPPPRSPSLLRARHRRYPGGPLLSFCYIASPPTCSPAPTPPHVPLSNAQAPCPTPPLHPATAPTQTSTRQCSCPHLSSAPLRPPSRIHPPLFFRLPPSPPCATVAVACLQLCILCSFASLVLSTISHAFFCRFFLHLNSPA